MRRREILGVAGLGLASAACSPSRRSPSTRTITTSSWRLPQGSEVAPRSATRRFITASDQVKDGHAEHHATAILTIDCQEFCGLASEIMARESPLISIACLAAADACKLCAAECSKHDDPQMKEWSPRARHVRRLVARWPRRSAKVSPRPKTQASKPVGGAQRIRHPMFPGDLLQ